MEATMPAKLLALGLILIATAARADSASPLFGSAATGQFEIADFTGSVTKIAQPLQLRMREVSACSGETCPNPRNFAKASHPATVSPQ
jgi:hypothetical protein